MKLVGDLVGMILSDVSARELLAKFALFFPSWTTSLNTAAGQKDHNLKMMSCSKAAENPIWRPEFILQVVRHEEKKTT